MRKQNLTDPSKLVGIWLLIGVVMIIIQIVLGGITRLTGSGLSITEWKPLLGALPPLSEREWQEAFKGYQEIAQFKQLNSHFTLADFKLIFFWEWFHRLWARVMGLVFIVPFALFWIKGYFKKEMIQSLIILFLLGALQGLIGWIMVKSGLNDENLYVSHIRLAIHFIAALVLLVYTYWFALKLLVPNRAFILGSSLKNFALVITILLTVQLTYGAFMAGLKAGVFAPTWPDINGQIFPTSVTTLNGKHISWLSSLIDHPLMIHFIHRTLGYIIAVLIGIWTVISWERKESSLFNAIKILPLVFVLIQVILGVYATITSFKSAPQVWGIFEWNAQLHQLNAIFLLLALCTVIFSIRKTGV